MWWWVLSRRWFLSLCGRQPGRRSIRRPGSRPGHRYHLAPTSELLSGAPGGCLARLKAPEPIGVDRRLLAWAAPASSRPGRAAGIPAAQQAPFHLLPGRLARGLEAERAEAVGLPERPGQAATVGTAARLGETAGEAAARQVAGVQGKRQAGRRCLSLQMARRRVGLAMVCRRAQGRAPPTAGRWRGPPAPHDRPQQTL